MHRFKPCLFAVCGLLGLFACSVEDQVKPGTDAPIGGLGGVSGSVGGGTGGIGGTGASTGGGSGGVPTGGTSGGSAAGGSTDSSDEDGGGLVAADGGAAPMALDADCDLNGIWLAQQITVSIALGASQYANTYFYLEIAHDGTDFQVTKSINCGMKIQGTATVTLSNATTKALMAPNSQVGRKGTMRKGTGGNCEFVIDRFWDVRGAPEQEFAPMPRNIDQSIAQVQTWKALPTEMSPGSAMDWDLDGRLGVAFNVAGPVNGTRHAVQRDWNRWYSDASAGYVITPAADWTSDLVVRAQSDSEESVMATDPSDLVNGALLRQLAPSDVMNVDNRLKLRFVGRDLSDPRAAAVPLGALDPLADPDGTFQTCMNVQTAMPIEMVRP